MFRNLQPLPIGNGILFECHELDLAYVNGIRRTILTDIPVAGFVGEDEGITVEILENNGPFHNEILAHRIGLIPIYFNEEETESFAADHYEFTIDMKNEGTEMMNVTTADFRGKKNDQEIPSREMHRLFPVNSITKDAILITRLRPGEVLRIRAIPVIQTARKHAGFSPVSCASLMYLPDPVKAATATNILDKERAYLRNEYGEATVIRMEIESENGLSPTYLVSKALEILRQKMEKILVEVSQEDSSYIRLQDKTFTFQQEDDTLGNLLQSRMYEYYVRGKKTTERGKDVTYVGYMCPHPLETIMQLKIEIGDPEHNDTTNAQEYKDVLMESCRRIQMELNEIETKWSQFSKA